MKTHKAALSALILSIGLTSSVVYQQQAGNGLLRGVASVDANKVSSPYSYGSNRPSVAAKDNKKDDIQDIKKLDTNGAYSYGSNAPQTNLEEDKEEKASESTPYSYGSNRPSVAANDDKKDDIQDIKKLDTNSAYSYGSNAPQTNLKEEKAPESTPYSYGTNKPAEKGEDSEGPKVEEESALQKQLADQQETIDNLRASVCSQTNSLASITSQLEELIADKKEVIAEVEEKESPMDIFSKMLHAYASIPPKFFTQPLQSSVVNNQAQQGVDQNFLAMSQMFAKSVGMGQNPVFNYAPVTYTFGDHAQFNSGAMSNTTPRPPLMGPLSALNRGLQPSKGLDGGFNFDLPGQALYPRTQANATKVPLRAAASEPAYSYSHNRAQRAGK